MRLFGLEVSRAKSAATASALPVESRSRSWFGIVREPFAGAWQRDIEVRLDDVMTFSAVYSCVTLIASDLAKMAINLIQADSNGIWTPTTSPAFSPVLAKPNGWQNRIEFVEQWILSKLLRGNAYVLKQRDGRGVVTALYVLNPDRVKVLVAPDGGVYYQLGRDDLSGVGSESLTVPASEIIHDRINALYHPLVGISPIHACGLAATQGLRIQRHSARFFENNSMPGGILSAPGTINQETADRLRQDWQEKFTGENAGKVAVAGDGLKFEQLMIKASDAELINQLKWTAETVCSCFRVPAYKVGVGAAPLNNNVEALDQQYYSQCLQILIEKLELCLDEGLALPATYGVQFDLDGLLRMDQATQISALVEAVGGQLMSSNEARKKLNLPSKPGGDAILAQQQNFSLEALADRDADKPFTKPPATTPPAGDPAAEKPSPAANDNAKAVYRRSVAAMAREKLHARRG